MLPSEITTDILRQALRVALEAVEGADLYNGGPWTIDMRLLDDPKAVIYMAADGDAYERTFTIEIEGDTVNTILSSTRTRVEARTVWIPLVGNDAFSFSAAAANGGWSGRIFRAGEYRERNLSFSVEDLQGMVDRFPSDGVPIKTEHIDTVWCRALVKCGAKVDRVWTENGGTELWGHFSVPQWAIDALDDIKKAVSVGLTNTFDAIREVSLVLNPRVEDAMVFRMATAFRASPDFQPFAAEFPTDAAKIATQAHKAPAPAPEDMDKPTFRQRLQALFSGKTPEQRAALTDEQILDAVFTDQPTPAPTFAIDPTIRADIDALKGQTASQQAQFNEQADANDAARFFLEEMRAGRAAPHEETDVIEQFSLARFKDRATQATFAANAEGSAEKALRDRFAGRPVQFRIGTSVLPSGATVDLSTNPLGIFKDSDFGGTEAK